ncbi:MAG: hypothetical protein JOY90_34950 [Bradyrhizobium sp.]|uniref:hypothetical protein n=1 Tax=Bradyrhizobium sp. TaxID=376 RepID=UPI001DA4A55E|nr:hypothetical protein [Bradyrhizobium sp.]MBV9565613.1 hypothetical protein [Bradyrhizobium sp.]
MSRIQPATSLLAAAIAAASMTPASSQTAKGARVVTAVAVGEQGKIQESNEWTVGIAGGLLEGTNIRFASEEAPPPAPEPAHRELDQFRSLLDKPPPAR